jgi:hypothetical protein
MPVAGSQPVYPPPAGSPVTAGWGQSVSEVVVQHFTTVADRDAKWTSPPVGSVCVTADTIGLWYRRTGGWVICTPRTYDQQKAWST